MKKLTRARVVPIISASVSWLLFAIIFVWTPPHFWALAVRYRDDYTAAGVPMMPVVKGVAKTARQSFVYTLVLVAVTLWLYPAASMGLVYLAAAVVLGGLFIRHAILLMRDPNTATRMFSYSIIYLGLLFAAIATDTLIFG